MSSYPVILTMTIITKFVFPRPMYVDSSNETEPSGQIPVSKLLIQHIEPLLVVRLFVTTLLFICLLCIQCM